MAAAATKTYNVSVTINVKRGKDEVDFARSETEKLYNLIGTDKQVEWAKNRIEAVHEMIFLPPADKIKEELLRKLEDSAAESTD